MRLRIVIVLTAMSIGRAMTLPFIGSAGDGGPSDPPDAWLMPLVGDAVIGLAAIVIVGLLITRRTVETWAAATIFHAVAAFDALAAYLVEIQTPWPEFFMLELFGRSMFFAAAAMHIGAFAVLWSTDVRARFGMTQTGTASRAH